MKIKQLAIDFALIFALALVVVTVVTFLWNLIGHGTRVIDWETSFRFAIIFSILLTWANNRKPKVNDPSNS